MSALSNFFQFNFSIGITQEQITIVNDNAYSHERPTKAQPKSKLVVKKSRSLPSFDENTNSRWENCPKAKENASMPLRSPVRKPKSLLDLHSLGTSHVKSSPFAGTKKPKSLLDLQVMGDGDESELCSKQNATWDVPSRDTRRKPKNRSNNNDSASSKNQIKSRLNATWASAEGTKSSLLSNQKATSILSQMINDFKQAPLQGTLRASRPEKNSCIGSDDGLMCKINDPRLKEFTKESDARLNNSFQSHNTESSKLRKSESLPAFSVHTKNRWENCQRAKENASMPVRSPIARPKKPKSLLDLQVLGTGGGSVTRSTQNARWDISSTGTGGKLSTRSKTGWGSTTDVVRVDTSKVNAGWGSSGSQRMNSLSKKKTNASFGQMSRTGLVCSLDARQDFSSSLLKRINYNQDASIHSQSLKNAFISSAK